MPGIFDIKNPSRKGWKTYRFDHIARSISERVEPKQTELEIYVGLEHIDPQSLHIKRWGTPADVEGTKLKVYPGDLIFGKRRAYQRKAAIANFEGICSAHAMVLRANPDVIDPKLFPFFIHSDAFMQRAIDISVGSLSPTINWGTLKTQEFLLPPKEQQAKLAELLWAADDVVEAYREMEKELEYAYRAAETTLFGSKTNLLKEAVIKVVGGGTPNTKNKTFYENGTIDWITTSTMNSLFIQNGEKLINEEAIKKSAAKLIEAGSIIVGTRVGIGKCCIVTRPFAFSQDVTGLVINPAKAHAPFIALQILSRKFQENIHSKSRGTTIKGILKDDLLNVNVFLPCIEEQKTIADKLLSIRDNFDSLKELKIQAQYLQRQLINSIFG